MPGYAVAGRAAAVLLLLFASPASAQSIALSGRLVLADSTTPAVGVVIEAEVLGDSRLTARTIAGTDGRFRLQLPRPGRVRLRALRIGFRPTLLGDFDVTQDRVLASPLVVRAEALRLATITIDARDRCALPADDGSLIATLLSQGRAALTSTVSALDGVASASRWVTSISHTDHAGVRLAEDLVASGEDSSATPFGGLDPSRLAAEGYVVSVGDSTVYRAPDAHVLLSDEFMETHCFRVLRERAADSSDVALSFEPVSSGPTTKTDITGTMVFERSSGRLRRVAFKYVGIEHALDAAGAGGMLHFAEVAPGRWIVASWWIRMPRLSYTVLDGERERSTAVELVTVRSGQVQSVSVAGQPTWQIADSATNPSQAVPGLRDGTPTCGGASRFGRNYAALLFGAVTDSRGARHASAIVRVEWPHPGGAPVAPDAIPASRRVSTTDGVYLVCGLPVGWPVRVWAYGDSDLSPLIELKIDRAAPARRIEMQTQPRP